MVLRNGWKWEQIYVKGDSNIYYKSAYLRSGKPIIAHAAAAPHMGMTASAIACLNMIRAFKPAILAMVGVMGGIRDRANLGDIVVADPTWDWGSGKITRALEGETLQAAPRQLPLDQHLRTLAQTMSGDHEMLAEIESSWVGTRPDTRLRMHVGPVASGAAVVADAGVGERILAQHRKLLGVDMEAYGVFAAAEGAPEPRPKAIVIKSVVDFGDSDKEDSYQDYGAYTSAQALRYFVEHYVSE